MYKVLFVSGSLFFHACSAIDGGELSCYVCTMLYYQFSVSVYMHW